MSFSESLEASASRWSVSRRTAIILFLAPFVGLALIVALRLVSRDLFRTLLHEDGVVEWSQFAGYAVGAVVAAWIAILRFRVGHRWQALVYALIAIGLLFVAGEEISWGQRVLGFETPEEIEEVNEQGEITLHNIGGMLKVFNLGLLVASAYAMVAEPLAKRLRIADRWDRADVLFAPPLFLAGAFAVMAAFRLVRFVVITDSGFTITRFGEWAELCFSGGIFIFLLLVLREVRGPEPGL